MNMRHGGGWLAVIATLLVVNIIDWASSRVMDTGFFPSTVLCGAGVVVPGLCPTDIDRNGDTGIDDVLGLLGGSGACR